MEIKKTENYFHTPSPRVTKNPKPFLIIICGKSGIGKTTLAKMLTNCDNFVYYGMDLFTIDPDIPIKSINDLRIHLGKYAQNNINSFESLVYENKDEFIDYCYSKFNENNNNIIIEGVWFNNETFLKKFKDRCRRKYKIWVMFTEI